MNKGYTAFIGVLAVSWVVTLVIDVIMTLALYPSRFGAIASITGSVTSNSRVPIYIIIGLPEAVGLFYPPYLFWALFAELRRTFIRSLPRFENWEKKLR